MLWAWVPITVFAAFAQTLRNAAQRSLLDTLGTILVRFLYGLPFAAAWLGLLLAVTDERPAPDWPTFAGWVTLGALCQIAGTALMLRVMARRTFAVGVVYSNSELLQVALFGAVFLGDALTALLVLAVILATVGVVLISAQRGLGGFAALLAGVRDGTALLGLLSGTAYGIAAVGFRGGALSVADASAVVAAACALVAAQSLQTVLLGGWLLYRNPTTVAGTFAAWRVSLTAGFMGAAASAGWFTAMTLESVARVRTLGAIEIVFALVVSRRLFRERVSWLTLTGIALLGAGVVLIASGR